MESNVCLSVCPTLWFRLKYLKLWDGSPWNLVLIFMVLRGGMLTTPLTPWGSQFWLLMNYLNNSLTFHPAPTLNTKHITINLSFILSLVFISEQKTKRYYSKTMPPGQDGSAHIIFWLLFYTVGGSGDTVSIQMVWTWEINLSSAIVSMLACWS